MKQRIDHWCSVVPENPSFPLDRWALRLGCFCPHWTPMMNSVYPTLTLMVDSYNLTHVIIPTLLCFSDAIMLCRITAYSGTLRSPLVVFPLHCSMSLSNLLYPLLNTDTAHENKSRLVWVCVWLGSLLPPSSSF